MKLPHRERHAPRNKAAGTGPAPEGTRQSSPGTEKNPAATEQSSAGTGTSGAAADQSSPGAGKAPAATGQTSPGASTDAAGEASGEEEDDDPPAGAERPSPGAGRAAGTNPAAPERASPTAGRPPTGTTTGAAGHPGPAAPRNTPEAASGRPWTSRRKPAAIAAALTALVAGILLFEAVWQRTDHRATLWFDRLTQGLATRPVDDVWVLTGAAIAAAAGLLLLVLAVTPGLRRRLPLRTPAGPGHDVSATLDRKGAALLLRDEAMRVPGVAEADVTVRRRRVSVRARAGFRDREEVREDVAEAVRRECRDGIGFSRTRRVRVRVRPAR